MFDYTRQAKRIAVSALLCLGLTQSAIANEVLVPTTQADSTEASQYQPKYSSAHPKIGLALGGGGARGAAHIGVLKVLEKEGIKFDYVCGTSIGSVVGGFYSAGVSPDQLQDSFESGALMKKFMTIPLWLRVAAAPVLYVPRLFGSKAYDGLYRGNAFREYLVKGLPASDQQIENLPIPYAAVALSLLDGKPYMIRKGNLGRAMQASCAVPSLRKPVEIEGNLFCDGGVACNLPVKQCRQMGADFVIAVNIDEPFKKESLDTFRRPGAVTKRMVSWALWDIDTPQGELADITIHPNTEGVTLISTKKSDAKRLVEAGEQAAQEALPLIRAKLAKLAESKEK